MGRGWFLCRRAEGDRRLNCRCRRHEALPTAAGLTQPVPAKAEEADGGLAGQTMLGPRHLQRVEEAAQASNLLSIDGGREVPRALAVVPKEGGDAGEVEPTFRILQLSP